MNRTETRIPGTILAHLSLSRTVLFAILAAARFSIPTILVGRRYIEHGVFRTALLIYFLRLAYWLAVPPHRLKGWFRDARGK